MKSKLKPQKKKKGSYEEDATYIPTPEEKKKGLKKRKARPTGVVLRGVRAKRDFAAEKQTTTIPEAQSVQTPEIEKHDESKGPESPEYEKVVKNVEEEVQYMGERKSTPPASPVNPIIHIQDDPVDPSQPKKDTSSSSFNGFPKVHGEFPEGDYDMFNDGKINVLTKKEKLEKMKAENAELKKAVNDHADRINELTDDYEDQAKVIDRITAEFDEVNEKYELMSESNKTMHQMIDEVHESSSNENKALRQEIEALRATKAVKDEQLNMLYTVIEHKLGFNVQAVYDDPDIQRVEQRSVAREKELAEEATQKKKSVVIDNEEILGSSSQQDQPEAEGTIDSSQQLYMYIILYLDENGRRKV
ncbi:hypothetical protein Hanom_Chr02g00147341 [Helianthus anomalus]